MFRGARTRVAAEVRRDEVDGHPHGLTNAQDVGVCGAADAEHLDAVAHDVIMIQGDVDIGSHGEQGSRHVGVAGVGVLKPHHIATQGSECFGCLQARLEVGPVPGTISNEPGRVSELMSGQVTVTS